MAGSAASYQAPPRASNSLKATNIANELLNASYSRVRTFHPVLELDLPEIVMEGCGSESPDCKIVYKSVKNYSGCTHGACRLTESSVGRKSWQIGSHARANREAGRNKPEIACNINFSILPGGW